MLAFFVCLLVRSFVRLFVCVCLFARLSMLVAWFVSVRSVCWSVCRLFVRSCVFVYLRECMVVRLVACLCVCLFAGLHKGVFARVLLIVLFSYARLCGCWRGCLRMRVCLFDWFVDKVRVCVWLADCLLDCLVC